MHGICLCIGVCCASYHQGSIRLWRDGESLLQHICSILARSSWDRSAPPCGQLDRVHHQIRTPNPHPQDTLRLILDIHEESLETKEGRVFLELWRNPCKGLQIGIACQTSHEQRHLYAKKAKTAMHHSCLKHLKNEIHPCKMTWEIASIYLNSFRETPQQRGTRLKSEIGMNCCSKFPLPLTCQI